MATPRYVGQRYVEQRFVEPRKWRIWGAVLLATIVSCSSGDTVEEYVNEGTWCLRPTDAQSVTATVITPGCYSGSCSEGMVEQCTLTRDGSTLTLTSLLRVKQLDHEVCTSDCRIYRANCSLSGLAEGQYELVHGDTRTTVNLPLPDDGLEGGDNTSFCPRPLSSQ